MEKGKKRLGCGLFVLAFLLGAGFFAVENVLPYSIIKPYKMPISKSPVDLGLAFEAVEIEGAGGVKLRGWLLFPAKNDSASGSRSLIFCHGIGNNRTAFLERAGRCSRLGWHCLLLDGRAQGESGGDFCTFGFFEKKDMACAVDFLEKRLGGGGQKIGIWGASLGGAVALQSLEAEKRLDFGIVESTFCDLPTVISDYQKRYFFGIRLGSATEKALKKAGEIAGFDPQNVRPAESARGISQPVFLAHGSADDRISVENGRRIFENLAGPKKQLFIVEGADHLNVHRVGGAELQRRIEAFLAENE